MRIWNRVQKGLIRGRRSRQYHVVPRFEQLEERVLLSADIQGMVFLDANGNGVQDSGEMGIPGWTVSLDTGQTATTGSDGHYQFTDLTAGTYAVAQTLIPGFTQTSPTQEGVIALQYEWARTTASTAGSMADATVVRTDASGNIFLAGTFQGTVDLAPGTGLGPVVSNGSRDVYVTKLNPDGSHAWTRTFGGAFEDSLESLVVDSSGNLFVAGSFGMTVDFDPTSGVDNRTSVGIRDGFLLKLNADGSYGWAKTFGGTDAHTSVLGICRDASGNLYLTGTFSKTVDFNPGAGADTGTAPEGVFGIFVTRIHADGTYGWTRTMSGNSFARGVAVGADSAGNLYVTGHFYRTVDFNPGTGVQNLSSSGDWDMFVAKFTVSGDYLWTKQIGGSDWDMVQDIKIDGSGNIYLAGVFSTGVDFNPDAGTDDRTTHSHLGAGFLTKLNADGSYAWTQVMGDSSSRWAATGLALDPSGQIYVVGERWPVSTSVGAQVISDLFLSKVDSCGQLLWTQLLSGLVSGTSESDPYLPYRWGVHCGAQGEVLVSGRFTGTVDLCAGPAYDPHSTGGAYDAFVFKQTPTSAGHSVTLGPDGIVQGVDFGNQLTGTSADLSPIVTALVVEDETPTSAGYTHQRLVRVALEATDIGGTLQGWMITESATPPDAGSASWLSSAPTSTWLSAGDGVKTLYAWVKDNDGRVSALTASSQAQIILDTVAPTVTVMALTTLDRSPALTGTVDDPDATVRVTVHGATYTAANHGDGTWTLAAGAISPALADGTYEVQVEACDLAGNRGVDPTSHELVVDTSRPIANLNVANITLGSSGPHTFTVTYQSEVGIDVSSLDSSDLWVTGPLGYGQLATFIGVDSSTNGSPRVATYQITAPGGSWNGADNGTYMVTMQASQVRDTASPVHTVAAGPIGQFQVSIVPPVVSIGDASIAEGQSGLQALQFEVVLSNPSHEIVTVNFSTSDGTALAGPDYQAAGGTLTFEPGQTYQTLTVLVQGDTTLEADETLTVQLTNPQNGVLGDALATGTLVNDDLPPMPPVEVFSGMSGDFFDLRNTRLLFTPDDSGTAYTALRAQIDGAFPTDPTGGTLLSLGDNGSVQVTLTEGKTVRLFGESYGSFYVGSNGYLTFTQPDADGSESLEDQFRTPRVSALFADLMPRSDTTISTRQLSDRVVVTWQNIGQPSVSTARNSFQVAMYFDGRVEMAWLSVYAGKAIVGLSDGHGVPDGFLEADLSSGDWIPTLSIADASRPEGNSGSAAMAFTVTLSHAVSQDVTVRYSVLPGTATPSTDYTPVSGVLTIYAGQTAGTIHVPVLGDTRYEYDETLVLNLSEPRHTFLSNTQATGTIVNDDPVVLPVVHSFAVEALDPVAPGYTSVREVAVSIAASDPDGTITAWAITESPNAPAPDAPVWQATPPDRTTIVSPGDGVKTLYLWVQDNYGMVSVLTALSQAQITLDTTGPVVTVTPLSTKDDTPALSGTVDDPTAAVGVTIGGRTYMAVNQGNGIWTLADNTIWPALPRGVYDVLVTAIDPLGNVGVDATLGELDIDFVAPTLLSWGPVEDTGIDPQDKVTRATPFVLTFTFSEAVMGTDADITVLGPGGTAVTPDSITGWGTATLTVDLTSQSEQGTYTVTLSNGIHDVVHNPFGGQTLQVTLDTVAPTLLDWSLEEQAPGGADPVLTTDPQPVLTLHFSEPVFSATGAITVLGPDGQAVAAVIGGLGTDTITVSFDQPLRVAGYYAVILQGSNTVTDLAGNVLHDGAEMSLVFQLDIPLHIGGGEFAVPSVTSGDQYGSAAAADAQGNFVVAWYSPTVSGTGLMDVYMRRFDAAGNPVTSQQRVTTQSMTLPATAGSLAVAMADDGRFVVVWERAVGGQSQVQMRVFDAHGVAVTGILTLSTAPGQGYLPDVAIHPTTGEFAVGYTYQAEGLVVPGHVYDTQVYVQRFSATGTALGGPIVVSSTDGKAPELAMDRAGRVLVVWNADHLLGRFITADGALAGDAFVITESAVGEGLIQTTSVATDGEGRFVVAWDQMRSAVFARGFSSEGTALGEAFQVNGLGDAFEPAVVMDAAGRFVVTWANLDRDGDGSGIYTRRYEADGTAAGLEVRVNVEQAGHQFEPSMALGAWGRILVCWTTPGSSTADGWDLHGRWLDYVGPTATVQTFITDSLQPGLAGTVDEPRSEVYVTVAGQTQSATVNDDGTWIVEPGLITLPDQDEAYDVQITAVDWAGNTTQSTVADVVILDRGAPNLIGWTLTEDTGKPTDRLTADTTPEVTFVCSEPVMGDDDSVEVWFAPSGDGEAAYEASFEVVGWNTNQLTVRPTEPLTQDGQYIVLLVAGAVNDLAGKPLNNGAGVSASFTLDKTVPVVSVENVVTDNTLPTLRGQVSDLNATIKVTIGGRTYTAYTEYETWSWSVEIPTALTAGHYDVVVTAADDAGNVGTASGTVTIMMLMEDFEEDGESWEYEPFFLKWKEVYEGNRNVPSPAPVGSTRSWGPSVGGNELWQVSDCYSSTDSLARKGTYLLFQQGSEWTDYKVSTFMRSTDDGDLGLMFRVQDADNYYRFSWNRAKGERRLVKCVNGNFTLLASDKAPMVKGRSYGIQVLADGQLLEVIVDQTRVFSVKDTSLSQGTFAFYCHSNKNALFDTLRVETLVDVNQPPRITAFEASAPRILDTQTVQLLADAFDPDEGKPVTYKWVLEEGQGTFDDDTLSNPVFTPVDVTGSMTCKIHVEISDGTLTVKSDTLQVVVYDADAPTFLADDFNDGDLSGWIVRDQSRSKSVWDASTGSLLQKKSVPTTLVYEVGTVWQHYQTDVDLTSKANAAIGVMFRVQDDKNYYRFVWDNKDGTRRLQRCVNGTITDLASDQVRFTKGQVYRVRLIVKGPYLEVDIDGQRIFAVTDATFGSGTIALYCSKNKTASFDNLLVTNLKNADLAPVIASATAAPAILSDEQAVQLQTSAYDPDQGPVTYHWMIQSGQGTFSDPEIANPLFVPSDVTGLQTVVLKVEVSDGTHTVSRTVELKVVDADAQTFLADDFNDGDLGGWIVQDLGKGTPAWSISAGVLNHKSSTPTALVYETGAPWIHYQTDVDLRSNASAAIGVMFRVQDENNYYRFLWNNKDGTRRLQRCVNGQLTDLASDKAKFTLRRTYKVSLVAYAEYLDVSIDGQRIFAVTDGTFGAGTIALYSSNNKGASFDNVVVTNLRGADLAPLITTAQATPSLIKDTGATQLQASAYDPDADPLTYHWVVESGEGTFSDPDIANPVFTPGDVTALETMILKVEASDGTHTVSQTVEVMVLDADAPVILYEDFSDGQFDGWKTVDQGTVNKPSNWSAASRAMVQDSAIYRWYDSLGRRGTFAKVEAGVAWTNYEVSLTMQSASDGDIGLMFRVKDNSNYYRFSMNAAENYSRLVRCKSGRFTELASAERSYVSGQTYQVRVLVLGSLIRVYVDNAEVFSVNDASLTTGSIALYSSNNPGSIFDNIVVRAIY